MAAKKKRKSKKTTPAGLETYRSKRDFTRTAEPAGGDVTVSASGRAFVVQKHAARNLHYDFRLEHDGVLWSWAVPKGPSLDPGQKPLAVHTEDHPIEYATFEGVIPPDEYGGGTVMLWDYGEWEPIGDPAEGYARGDLKFRLHGEKLRGAWAIVRMKGEDGRNWLLIKKKDESARAISSYNVLAEMPFSVASGRTMDEIAAAPVAVWKDGHAQRTAGGAAGGKDLRRGPDPSRLENAAPASTPATLKPQLCETAAHAPDGDRWLHEVKLDGYRLLCRVGDGEVRLFTRNGHDWTDRFPAVARAAGRLPIDEAWLDGEVVVLDEAGMPDFGALQNAIGGESRKPFTYYLFDVPHAAGFDLTRVPLLARKAYLASLIDAAPSVAPTILYCEHFVGNGPTVFAHAADLGLEGVISKRVDARYVSRRADTWLKVKNRQCEDFVVGGYTRGSGSRSGFGALLVGRYDDDNRLIYCGRVGSGFSEKILEALETALGERARETPPFANPDADPDARNALWVRPELVVQVEFTAWTRENLLRHAVFLGRREDVEPARVRAPVPASVPDDTPIIVTAPRSPADASIAGVRISNPDRTVYPEARITKREVAEYYARIAEWGLPHLVRRPLSLVRCPLGLAGESFYQRHVLDGFPKSIRGTRADQPIEGEPYLLIDDLTGLISLAQMGVLEIHIWGAREDDLEKPDQLVFDLDPGEGIEWEHLVASARFLRQYLDDLGLRSFVKTSGGKGIHVVVPITRRSSWADAKTFTHAIAKDVARIAPRNFVATMSKDFRRNRIYVDYLRNTRGATAVAPYSTRARPGALVATPLEWDELSAAEPPAHFTVRTVPERLERGGDPWAELRTVRQSITADMKRALGLG